MTYNQINRSFKESLVETLKRTPKVAGIYALVSAIFMVALVIVAKFSDAENSSRIFERLPEAALTLAAVGLGAIIFVIPLVTLTTKSSIVPSKIQENLDNKYGTIFKYVSFDWDNYRYVAEHSIDSNKVIKVVFESAKTGEPLPVLSDDASNEVKVLLNL